MIAEVLLPGINIFKDVFYASSLFPAWIVVLWKIVVPCAFTSVRTFISSFGTWSFSLGAVPKLPVSRLAACSCICLLCPWRPCSAYLIFHSPPHFAFHNTSFFPYCHEHFCVWILQVQRSKRRIPVEICKDWEKMKVKIKRVWNPLQCPYLGVCHYFIYVFYCNLSCFLTWWGYRVSLFV